jgi:hypothetical protein
MRYFFAPGAGYPAALKVGVFFIWGRGTRGKPYCGRVPPNPLCLVASLRESKAFKVSPFGRSKKPFRWCLSGCLCSLRFGIGVRSPSPPARLCYAGSHPPAMFHSKQCHPPAPSRSGVPPNPPPTWGAPNRPPETFLSIPL